uniref:Uncharacterized protein n=1 Tax=Candidatus Kentrum sp. LFY TaxID=2126342 RepID=A0A450WVS2_9GAMM|nr:MAG: hypothetical protein BECKLFY1418C_GA0070996_10863 [Candidatus Kentron sp. LFY]
MSLPVPILVSRSASQLDQAFQGANFTLPLARLRLEPIKHDSVLAEQNLLLGKLDSFANDEQEINKNNRIRTLRKRPTQSCRFGAKLRCAWYPLSKNRCAQFIDRQEHLRVVGKGLRDSGTTRARWRDARGHEFSRVYQ